MIYILIYCLKGTLPWKGQLTMDYLAKTQDLKAIIQEWHNPQSNQWGDIPSEMKEILNYAQNMEFEEEPDYEMIENEL